MSESHGPSDAPPTVPGPRPPAAGDGLPGRSAVPAPPAGRGLVLLALGVAGLALLLAFGSAIFAWRAVDQAKDAKNIALRPGTAADPPAPGGSNAGPPTASAPIDADSAAPDDTPRSPGEAPQLTERTAYRPRYERQPLIVKSSCDYSMYVDLDEPRVRNDSDGADVGFTTGCVNSPAALRLEDGVEGTDAATAGMTPQDCADKIRTAPIGRDQPIPVRKGVAICVTTDYADARAHGNPWRMALIEVVGMANDGSATLQVTGWDIPDA